MKCIVYHRKFGEVERHTVSVEMLRANIEESKGRLTKKKGRA
jgi:hypothetical protein